MDKIRWILITGTDTGIGKATTEYLSLKGFGIYAGCLKESSKKYYARMLNVFPVILDVTNEEKIKNAFKIIADRSTGLFGIVNNAGIALAGPAMELDVAIFKKQFDVNLFGVHRITKTFFPLIQESKGKIIMIGSGGGLIANPFFSPYSSSKFALEGYTDALRRELLILGIQVIMIEPGLVKTPIWDKGELILKNHRGNLLKKEVAGFGSLAINTARKKGLNPDKIAARIYKVLSKKKPKVRYFVTPDYLQNLIMKKMPAKCLDKLLALVIRKNVR